VGNRQGFLAVRNAEIRLARERTVFHEQQRQILHDLGAAYNEVDRALANIRSTYNAYVAGKEELETKMMRFRGQLDPVFFVLDAQQRFATAETSFYRAVVDYNRALLSYTYASGGLLARYNVQLNEADWDQGLQMIANGKANRFTNSSWGTDARDLEPVSIGPYDQGAPQNVHYSTAKPVNSSEADAPSSIPNGDSN
jgi:hypothetical protein